jgi:hypothetical protein
MRITGLPGKALNQVGEGLGFWELLVGTGLTVMARRDKSNDIAD